MTATSQHTENREDPGAGEDSPPLPCGALQAFSPSPQPWVIETRAHRGRGVADRRLERCRWGGVCIRVGCRGAREPALGTM